VVSNKSEKAVRLTVVVDAEALMMTVLAPGEAIKQDKALCEKFASGQASYDARFATLRQMPDEPEPRITAPVAAVAPRTKPSPVAPAPVQAKPIQVSTVGPLPAIETGPAQPRFKPAPPPAYPPVPRAKPAAPAAVAAAPVAPVPAVGPVAAVAPTAPVSPSDPAPTDLASCGDACATILFKVVDECLWIVNMHPRPVVFEAEAGGKRIALTLEAADGEKADARLAAVAKDGAPKTETGVHMRLHDPFESTGAGIPLYRARLGDANACVKARTDVTRFTARFLQ
jgi:hypothetical protein